MGKFKMLVRSSRNRRFRCHIRRWRSRVGRRKLRSWVYRNFRILLKMFIKMRKNGSARKKKRGVSIRRNPMILEQ